MAQCFQNLWKVSKLKSKLFFFYFLTARNSFYSLKRKVWNKCEVCKCVRMKSFWMHVESLLADFLFPNFNKYKTTLICQMSLTACLRASLSSVLLGNRVTASSREPRSWSGQWGSWRSNRTSRGLWQKHGLLWQPLKVVELLVEKHRTFDKSVYNHVVATYDRPNLIPIFGHFQSCSKIIMGDNLSMLVTTIFYNAFIVLCCIHRIRCHINS